MNGLINASEDVEYRDKTLGGVSRTSHIYNDDSLAGDFWGRIAAWTRFDASELLVCASVKIPRGYDWWYVAKGLAMAVGGRHSCHSGVLAGVLDRWRW